jgi:hypothetical protein
MSKKKINSKKSSKEVPSAIENVDLSSHHSATGEDGGISLHDLIEKNRLLDEFSETRKAREGKL